MTTRHRVSQDPDELYPGEREELLASMAKSEESIRSTRGKIVLAVLGGFIALALIGGMDSFRLGFDDPWGEHAGSIILGAIGVIGWRVFGKPSMAAFEGVALALFIAELFGVPARILGH